ncbi:MAG: TolC family protein [Saprospiraceae bacterium]|nr:TolC family protein [Saprospiraceae bacterium]
MKTTFFSLLLLLVWLPFAGATDSLGIEQVRQLAVQNSPLQQKKLLAESVSALQTRNIRSNNLPRVSVGAQASWQTDVFGLPIESPLFRVPEVPKDQYKLNVDVAQRIWDGNSDQYARRQRNLESQVTAAQTDVDVFQVREVVTDLFFKVLLLNESERILEATRGDLNARLKQAQAAVAGGVALRTTADQLQIQIWKTEQQLEAVRADRNTLLDILAAWIGRPQVDFGLVAPAMPPVNTPAGPELIDTRPEFKLIKLQQQAQVLQADALNLRRQPRVEAFVQGGLGSPNPLNFFETDFQPFAIIGLRAAWTPIDWGNTRRERQVLSLQQNLLDAQAQSIRLRLDAQIRRDRGEIAKADAQLRQDEEIIRLQEDIVKRAEAQVQNGVMTATDYLAQINILTQARLTRATHQIQARQAREMLDAHFGAN